MKSCLLLILVACSSSPTMMGDDGGDDTQPTFPEAHPRIYLTPNRIRLESNLAAGAPAAMRFKAKVDQWMNGSEIWGFEAWNAALISQLTGDSKYCAKAVTEIEKQVSTAEGDIASGSEPFVANDSYLEVGPMIGDLALVYDWCNKDLSGDQKTRWRAYANQAVWNVWHPDDAKWGSKTFPWSGWSIDNPSNNYYYSFLRATMLLGLATKYEDSQADAWITKFREDKIFGELVPTFERDLVGGASREGTGYGVAMRELWALYTWWHATTGEKLATKTKHTQASMFAFMHQVVPTLDRVAPTGDHSRDSTAAFFDYHRDYLQELMQLFPTSDEARRAKELLAASSVKSMENGFMFVDDFLADNPSLEPMPLSGLNTAYHAIGIGEIYARSSWDKTATWVNLIAGPYTESHAHQDQGSLMIYKGGWLAYDANVHSKSGLAQQTGVHGLVKIGSVQQVASTSSMVAALHQGNGYMHVAADLTPAYDGASSVAKVQREILYVLPDVIIVYDRVQSTAAQTWQLQTPTMPALNNTTATITNAGHTLTVTKIAGGGPFSTFSHATNSDFTGGFRLEEAMPAGDNRYLHVLSVDGAVTSAVAMGASGVTVVAAGKTIVANFERDAVGATLTIDGQATTLAAGVDVLAP